MKSYTDTFLATPLIYSLEITPSCNNRCIGCGNVFSREPVPLSFASWKRVITYIQPYASSIKLTGGEPTLHPEFESIVNLFAELDLSFTLFTNARWDKPEKIVTLLSSLPQCGGILVSLHGNNAEGHEAFTQQPGSFKETIENIRLASMARLQVHTSTVITKWNWNCVDEIVELSKKLGAGSAIFNRYIGQALPSLEPDLWQLREAIARVENLRYRGYPVKLGNCIPQCFVENSSTPCWAGKAYCTIDPWGNVRPCNHSLWVAGNLLSQSIEEIWQSEKMSTWRSFLPLSCRHCGNLFACQGGCRVSAEIRCEPQDPLMSNPLQNDVSTPHEMILSDKLIPLLCCDRRREKFGYVLFRGESLYLVTESANSLLNTLNGQYTLKDIRKQFDQEALNLIGALYENGLVRFESPNLAEKVIYR